MARSDTYLSTSGLAPKFPYATNTRKGSMVWLTGVGGIVGAAFDDGQKWTTYGIGAAFDVQAYGAVGDGAVLDDAAIQLAINAAQTAGGGTVRFPQGTYLLSKTLTVSKNNVVLVGSGQGAILEANANLNDDILLVAPPSGTLTGFAMQRFYVDGNQNNQTSGNGIHFKSVYNSTMDQVWVRYVHDTGLILDQVAGQAFSAYNLFQNCQFTDGYQPGSRGLWAKAGSEMNRFINCNFDWHSGDGGYGIQLDSGLNDFWGCQCDANGWNLYISANTKNRFISCLFDRAYRREILISGGSKYNHFIACTTGYYVDVLNLSGAILASNGAITSIPLKRGMSQTIPSNTPAAIIDYGTGTSDSFNVTSAGAAAGATSIPVTSHTPSHDHADNAQIILRYRGIDLEGSSGPNYFSFCDIQNAENLTNNFNWLNVVGEDANCSARFIGCEFGGGSLSFQSSTKSKIIQCGNSPVGPQGPPSVPSTTVALVNPYPYDCTLYITGGTVTAIAVGSTTTGLTLTTGATVTVRLAAGASITLTYSVTPTWVWLAD